MEEGKSENTEQKEAVNQGEKTPGNTPKLIYLLIVVFVVVIGILVYYSTKKEASEVENSGEINTSETPISEQSTGEEKMTGLDKYLNTGELVKEDTQAGSGDGIKVGQTAVVHYTGYLTDGTKFDSSVDRGAPFSFKLGEGRVIQGWEDGVVGMKVGGKRRLAIPPSLGYGNQIVGNIPANSILVFDIELLKIE